MARRTRIIYASQSVQAEGRILYRIRTLGSSTTFNTEDVFQLGDLNLTDIVDDSPEVAITLEGHDYGSIYTMATLAKVPTQNLNHNIRQSDGVTFNGTVGGFGDTSEGDLNATAFSGLPAASGTGKANIVIKDAPGGTALAYLHGVALPDFGRECGISKGVDIWSPIQSECSLGSANDSIEFTKLLKDVFVNNLTLTYSTSDMANEDYAAESEQKQWLLNSARFLSWEEWRVGANSAAGEILAATLGAKTFLKMSLASPLAVPKLDNKTLGFLKKDLAGRPSVLLTFSATGGLAIGESKAIPVFDLNDCIPTNVTEYFLYDSSVNTLAFYSNGTNSALSNVLPAGRSSFQNSDKVFAFYAANGYAVEVGEAGRPGGADSSYVSAKYFAPISSDDVEDVGSVRQGQIEVYLVDPDLLLKSVLTGAAISGASITFNNTVESKVDLGRFVGLKVRVVDGPGKNGPSREIIGASNSLSGNFNNGSITLGGSVWPNLRLGESSSAVSTASGAFVNSLCGVDADYVGSAITVLVSGNAFNTTISGVSEVSRRIDLSTTASGAIDDGSAVLVNTSPTVNSTILIGDYEAALRLQTATITSSLTREPLKELGRLNNYARPLTLPIQFTVSLDATASDLEQYATFAGKLNKYKSGTLTDIAIVDLFAKSNLTAVVMIYQQTDQEAGGSGLDRKVLSPDMFGDEYYVNGIKRIYDVTDGSLREYPIKTVVCNNLRITEENTNTPLEGNATQTFAFRGTNEVTVIRGFAEVDLVTKTIESQGE